jgi:hypothetical protein
MLNISQKQTTAYHPVANGAVERLHRRLKDALRAHSATATWSEELPFELLRLRAQPREETGLSPAEAVFGVQIVLPNEFLHNDELSVDTFVKIFLKTLHISTPSLPRHNSSTDLPSELLSAPLVFVCRGSLVPPLQPLYDSPYAAPAPSPSESGLGKRWLPSAVLRLAQPLTPRSPHRRGRPLGSRGGLAATKRVSFSDPLVSSPSPSSAPPHDGPGTIFLPGKEVFARLGSEAPSQPPQTQYPSRQRATP